MFLAFLGILLPGVLRPKTFSQKRIGDLTGWYHQLSEK
jgi:hypothetical protein